MAISFEESKKQISEQASTPMVASMMSLSNDAILVSENSEEVFTRDTSGKYLWYEKYSDDKLSTIDELKNVTVNSSQINLTQEENSQYIPFKMDRFYDGIDLTGMTINIRFVNAAGYEDIATAVNVQYSDTKIMFGWLVPASATAAEGDLLFEINAHGVNEKGDPYMWKSRPNGKLNVLKSLSGNGIVEPSQDWYSQFVYDMDVKIGLAQAAQANAEAAAAEAQAAVEDIKGDIEAQVSQQLEASISTRLSDYYTKTEVDSDITTKIGAALSDYYTKTEVDNIVSSIDISDQLVEINNRIDNIDGLAAFDVVYTPETGVMTFYNGTEVIKEFTIERNPTAEWEAAYDTKVDGKIETAVGTVSTEVTTIKNDVVQLSNTVSTNTNSISEILPNITALNTKVTDLEEIINNSTEQAGYEYHATYGTAILEATGEETENVFTLYETGSDGVEAVKSQFVITGGGGGSAPTTTLKVERITASPLTITTTDKAEIKFNCTSTDSDGETVDCSYTWKLGNTVISSGALVQGVNTFDMSEYVVVGTQKFTLTVTDAGGSMTVKTWTVQMVDVRIESSFNDRLTYEAGKPVSFTYTPYGAIEKTVHFILDGVELDSVVTAGSGLLQSYTLPAQEHGAHLLECYITATINGAPIETDHIYKDIIWYDETSDVPVIGCVYRNDYYGTVAARQYNATSITYIVYDPNTSTPVVNKTIDGVDAGTQTLDTYIDTWSYKSSEVGTRTLTISCGETTVTIVLEVAELGIDVTPVTANLAFDFNPVGYSNTGTDRLWTDETNSEVSMSVSDNFDWVNGGYQLDENGDQYFCVKSGTTATINYNLFADDPKKNGKEFKVVFKTTNVKRRSGTFISCMDTVGLSMGVESAYIYSSNDSLYVPYCEDDIIEFEFNINKDTDIPMVMSYEDGVGNRPMIYTSDSSFMQLTPKPIVIGSPDCDVHIYRMKAYSASLTDRDILSNFIADARNADEMIDRYNRNQIYDENGALTPEVLAERCPDLRVIKLDCPHFTNDKKDKVLNSTITMIYKNGDQVLDNWTCTGAGHSGQGTSSNEYGAAGRNLDFIMNYDDSLFTFSDGSTGKEITLTRNSVPVNYLNLKVNIASSENENNALLQRRYNDYNPYVRPAKVNDPRVRDTMEFYNCVIFVRENDPDITTHREFQNTDWNFYAIGNIGNSKKTDVSRVNDPTDPLECILEIMDYNLPLSEFPAGNEALALLDADNFDEKGTYGWRYTMDGITDEQLAVINEKWREFYRFVVNSTDQEFHDNLGNYFVVDSALYYYLFTERYSMVDNRAKNLFIHYGKCEDGVYRWDLCFDYDNDEDFYVVVKPFLIYGENLRDRQRLGRFVKK